MCIIGLRMLMTAILRRDLDVCSYQCSALHASERPGDIGMSINGA